MKYKFILTCVFVSLCLLNVPIRAEPLRAATTIVVNSTDDTVADDGQCTLREAITAANTDTASGATGGECVAGSGDDTIDLTGISGTIHLISPLPDITSNIIFNGPGASSLTIQRDTGGNYRVFTVGGGVSVTVSGLTMSNGSTVNDFGGGVYNAGTLTLNHSTVSNNSTQTSVVLGGHGGGIYNAGTLILSESAVENNSIHTTARDSYGGGIYNAGTLTLNHSTVSHNNTFGNKGHGGGIYNASALTLNNSTISDNSASTSGANGDGGGIKSFGNGSSVTLNNSTVSHNRSNGGGSGGGLWNSNGSVMELNNSTISSNVSTNNGGGINNSMNAALRLTNSIISENTTSSRGGGIWNDLGSTAELDNSTVNNNSAHDGGGIFNDNGTVILTNDSIINGNRADISGGGVKNDHDGILKLTDSTVSHNLAATFDGGGIDNLGTAQLTNSTVSGNRAVRDGGGIDNFGGDLVTLVNSTVSGNQANFGGGIANQGTVELTNCTVANNSADSDGGGIKNFYLDSTVELINTIVANQTLGSDCHGIPVTSKGHNLDSDGSCGFNAPGDLTADPLLGPLQDNGGPTETHALLSGSPAIDAADDNACPATDQRGDPRPADGNRDGTKTCDIGAYEFLLPGKIVVANDEWPLSDEGFPPAPDGKDTDTAQFALNVANWFTGGQPGDFLVYSTPFGTTTGLVGDNLRDTMTTAGHSWTIISTSTSFSLSDLLQYDGVFLAGSQADDFNNPPPVVPPDTQVLIDYVKAGGNVYLAGGTDPFGGPPDPPAPAREAAQWNPFLNACGLEFAPIQNNIVGTLQFNSSHRIFANVQRLYQENGNSIGEVTPTDPNGNAAVLIRSQQGEGLYAVCSFGGPIDEVPTAIDLLSFTAHPATDQITLTWQTGTEIDNAGFNLHRATAADGPYTRLNDAFISAEGDPVSGASYTYIDTKVSKGTTYYYKLEDVDFHGISTFHGPVSAAPEGIRSIYLPVIVK